MLLFCEALGPSGAGKTALMKQLLQQKQREERVQVISLGFSSNIKPATLQALLESKLETKRKALVKPYTISSKP